MSAFAYEVIHQCRRRDVATLDHMAGSDPADLRPMVNRVCLTCLTHWYGDALAAVFEMPGRVWDRWMQEPA
jgi:hypothetical protein